MMNRSLCLFQLSSNNSSGKKRNNGRNLRNGYPCTWTSSFIHHYYETVDSSCGGSRFLLPPRRETDKWARLYYIIIYTIKEFNTFRFMYMKEHSWLVPRNTKKTIQQPPLSKRDYEPHSLFSVYCVTSNQIKRRKGFLSFSPIFGAGEYRTCQILKVFKQTSILDFLFVWQMLLKC